MPADPASSTRELGERLLSLMGCESTSGREDRGLEPLLAELKGMAPDELVVDAVAEGRSNVLASWGRPRVLLTTHLDTVPPYLPPRRVGDDRIHGRGANDAKGQIVCQLEALRQLLARGETGFAFLGLVGEESDAAGAAAAARLAPRLEALRLIVNGEPTDMICATGQRGFLHLRLSTRGVCAHSGMPELGRHAIWPLIDWLGRLRELEVPVDPDLGAEIWNLGRIGGGRAANVIPDEASAELLCRSLPGSDFVERVRAAMPETEAEIEVLVDEPADRYPRLEGFPYGAMPFGSDLPTLRRLFPEARVALFGPGSIKVAHTEDEFISLNDLALGATLIRRLARTALQENP